MPKRFILSGLVVLNLSSAARAAPEDTTADAVLGQTSFTLNALNQGNAASSATSLAECRGVAVDQNSGRLWVCDSGLANNGNHRVLSWPSAASFADGDAADIVLGQEDFDDNLENRGGANPARNSLRDPRTVAVDSSGRVYVADSGNIRVLRFDPPFTNGEDAAQVFGQAGSYTTDNQANAGTANADNMGNPDGVAVDSAGNLYVADLALNRVLVFNTPADPEDTTADLVIGQANVNGGLANRGGANPAANTLAQPEGVAVDADANLYVVDQGNNRVLRFDAPLLLDQNASRIYGQPDAATATPGTSSTKMKIPVAAAVDPVSGNLYVADSGNNRILEFSDPANDSTADRVLGQGGNLDTGTSNNGGVSANSLADVGGVALDSLGNLFAGDRNNRRALRFNRAVPLPSDDDSDGVPNADDNCPSVANAGQDDADGDGVGDACENLDSDADGVSDGSDNCPNAANADQADADGDGIGDACESSATCGLCGPGIAAFMPAMVLALRLGKKSKRKRQRTE